MPWRSTNLLADWLVDQTLNLVLMKPVVETTEIELNITLAQTELGQG